MFVVNRICTVIRLERERHYIRLLLHPVRGATSYKYLLTVDAEECTSFREVCQWKELLIDDME